MKKISKFKVGVTLAMLAVAGLLMVWDTLHTARSQQAAIYRQCATALPIFENRYQHAQQLSIPKLEQHMQPDGWRFGGYTAIAGARDSETPKPKTPAGRFWYWLTGSPVGSRKA